MPKARPCISPVLEIKWSKVERYAVEASAYIEKRLRSTFALIVDTGSPLTIIMQDDLKRIRINLQDYEEVDAIDLARSHMRLVDPGMQTFNFHADTGRLASFRFKALGGLGGGDDRGFPSILGKDFLDRFNIGLTGKTGSGAGAKRYLEFGPAFSNDIAVKEF